MAVKSKNKSFMPGSSWEVIKRVIRAYHAVAGDDHPSGEGIAKLAGLPRPVISTNNNFLRGMGILKPDEFKLTETGSRLAVGMEMDDATMMRGTLQEAIQQATPIRDLLNIVRARGSMPVQSFKNEIILRLGLAKDSWQVPYIKTLLDCFEESQLISIDADMVSLISGIQKKVQDRMEPSDSVNHVQEAVKPIAVTSSGHKIPLPLGPNRLAYLELPPDWEKRELRKLIKLLEISLGDDEEVAKS